MLFPHTRLPSRSQAGEYNKTHEIMWLKLSGRVQPDTDTLHTHDGCFFGNSSGDVAKLAYAQDLKSWASQGREGSSPSIPTNVVNDLTYPTDSRHVRHCP
jgi:hypothetical protein